MNNDRFSTALDKYIILSSTCALIKKFAVQIERSGGNENITALARSIADISTDQLEVLEYWVAREMDK